MGVVDGSAGVGRRPAERDDLLGRRVSSGDIEEPGREPERAFLDASAHEGLHLPEFLPGGRAVLFAHHPAANRSVAHIGQGVHADSARFPTGERRRDFRGTPAVHAEHHGGDALVEEGQRLLGPVVPDLRMGVHVDESGRDEQPGDIQRLLAGDPGGIGVPDEDDLVPGDPDVRAHRFVPGTIQHGSAGEQQFDRLPAATGSGGQRERGAGDEKGMRQRPEPPGRRPRGGAGAALGRRPHAARCDSARRVSPLRRPDRPVLPRSPSDRKNR